MMLHKRIILGVVFAGFALSLHPAGTLSLSSSSSSPRPGNAMFSKITSAASAIKQTIMPSAGTSAQSSTTASTQPSATPSKPRFGVGVQVSTTPEMVDALKEFTAALGAFGNTIGQHVAPVAPECVTRFGDAVQRTTAIGGQALVDATQKGGEALLAATHRAAVTIDNASRHTELASQNLRAASKDIAQAGVTVAQHLRPAITELKNMVQDLPYNFVRPTVCTAAALAFIYKGTCLIQDGIQKCFFVSKDKDLQIDMRANGLNKIYAGIVMVKIGILIGATARPGTVTRFLAALRDPMRIAIPVSLVSAAAIFSIDALIRSKTASKALVYLNKFVSIHYQKFVSKMPSKTLPVEPGQNLTPTR